MKFLTKLSKAIALLTVLLLIVLFGVWSSVNREQVEFQSGDLTLRGTLLVPRWVESAPAIVMVHGSGEMSRRPLMPFAWLFAVKGYAALAYDKRGVGESEGQPHEWREFNFDNLAADAAAAYKFAQSRSTIDQNRVGFLGVSQGGWVVSAAASSLDSPDFIIMASASFSTVAEDRIFGLEARLKHEGFDSDAIHEASELLEKDHAVTLSGLGFLEYQHLWDAHKGKVWFKEIYGEAGVEPLNSAHRHWEGTVLGFNPVPKMKQLQTPVLWIFGDPELDRFSPVNLSMERVNQLKDEGKCHSIIQIDGVGHSLEPVNNAGVLGMLSARAPIVSGMYDWLDEMKSGRCPD